MLEKNFNCTIQELKLRRPLAGCVDAVPFQLHHTGIKTHPVPLHGDERHEFQLHHTGIKTTLQRNYQYDLQEFQLHHTGIKTQLFVAFFGNSVAFQLHHTGIKTSYKPGDGASGP